MITSPGPCGFSVGLPWTVGKVGMSWNGLGFGGVGNGEGGLATSAFGCWAATFPIGCSWAGGRLPAC